ncbi:MAG: glycosyltransferase family 39 protein [Chloroflexi bacterium]|nr:glycosyltransferase family 39 protein [Chloroflexota bacterium]
MNFGILTRLFDLAFAAFVVFVALALGRIILRRWGFGALPDIERDVFAVVVGLGAIVEILIGLSLAQLLYAPVLIALLLVLALIAVYEMRGALGEWQARWRAHKPFSRAERLLLAGMGVTALPVGVRALLPPTAYDALMYHLPAPKAFLEAHSFVAFPENVQANSPLAFDLLTTLGLSVGSDVFPQLLQFALGGVLALGVFEFAARAFGRNFGILAAAILVSIPVFGILAGWAYVDVAWVLCEFLSVYAFWNWLEQRKPKWLILSGVMMGLALSTKYLALQGMIVLALAIVIAARREGWQAATRNLIGFGLGAGFVAAPWYLKNWVWLGNPVYPYFFGGANYDAVRVQFNSYLVSGYGVGRDALAYIMLPVNIFVRSEEFGPVAISAPSFCFLLLPAYLRLPRSRLINVLLLISAARFAIWAVGAQELRFMFVVYPLLSIVSACLVSQLFERWRKPLLRVEMGILIGLIIGMGAWFQWQYALKQSNSFAFLAGVASPADFLRANLSSYRATEFVNGSLPGDAKILAISDGRTYYFEREFIPDTGRDHWHTRIAQGQTMDQVLTGWQAEGITHIWVSAEDLTHTYASLDRLGRARAEMRAFDEFKARYLIPVYRDARGFELYALPAENTPWEIRAR